MAQMKSSSRRLRSESGAELIELAITLPILIVVFAAMIDFAVLFQQYQVITNAAREGARVGTLPNYAIADVQARVNAYMASSGLNETAPAPAVTFGSEEVVPGGPSIDTVKVVVQYPHQFIFLGPAAGLIGGSAYGDLMLAAASTMRREIAAGP